MRVVIVSDQPIFLEALSRLVAEELDAEVEAWSKHCAAQPSAADLILLDFPPYADPADWIAAAATFGEGRRVLIVPERNITLARIARVHAFSGLLPKTQDCALWAPALRLVLAGGEYFPCFDDFDATAGLRPAPADLSARQTEVLRELVRGRTNKEIAHTLGVSVATVKLHVQAILMATGARNRTEVAIQFNRAV